MSQSYARRCRRMENAEKLRVKRGRGTCLDGLNERLSAGFLYLHPTRGYRKINPKRTVAETIVNMTKQGFGGETAHMKEALQDVS